ncbi:glycoside hydrolase family 2 TIM barrel-domain containing protein [Paenibacillus lignilyticus]|uniref:Glycoside hydrolase family 2 n=1 Tax=Paenibacillus lignilyticus TaxID=1172615 RepID=A0ABS5CI48_9BACL|nr:glycoside hydrolase family 2 TIM barrel-domain containing protein [Paenibacillus lignilyticus]MBP3965525.1 glycoside hydrolase family 2 [Paenibacillus lignilyticus]
MTDPICAYTGIQTTLSLQPIDGVHVPFQNGIPVPSFDPQDRLKLDLAGAWKKQRFEADHDFSMSARDERWFVQAREEAGGRTEISYNDSAWETIMLPIPENKLQGIEAANSSETYENGVWYRRSFKLGTEWTGKAVTLHALSISYVADVWVNGKWIGYHEGGYTPFALDLSLHVRYGGENIIVIRVDNPPWGSRNDIIPATAGTDFFNYTGIIHDLYVSGSAPCHLARVDVVSLDVEGNLRVTAIVENRSDLPAACKLQGSLFEADQKADAFLGSPYASQIKGAQAAWNGELSARLTLRARETRAVVLSARVEDAKLWAFRQPNLYIAEFKLSNTEGQTTDCFHTQFGIRTITTQGTDMLLNKRAIFLAGIARHEEWPDYGRTAAWDRIRDDLVQMKEELHVNYVRTAHYPNHVFTGMLLDRLGLATASEIPLWQFTREHFEVQEEKRLSDQMWREMVFSQYNRPSVLMWSTQNESVEVELRTVYNKRLVHDLKTSYPDGRLTTQSAAADQPGAHDPSMEPLDVASWTMYFGIFHGGTYYEGTRQFLEDAHRQWPNKPIVNTEYGHWSGENNIVGDTQIETYKETLKALMERAVILPDGTRNKDGFVAGIDYWIMYDWYVNHNNWIDTFGIYHMDRTTIKPVGELVRQDYRSFTEHEGGFVNEALE